ncbi:hypothetical protein H2203_001207 [Taxawa tesnikishii (nom. ined.)]|nr:hypothetical protein H2203_001207 [Dothideales sp. JES 119]
MPVHTLAYDPNSKERPMAPEIHSPGLESVWGGEVLTLILVLAVGLGAGLGAGLGTKHHSSKSSATPSASSTSAAPSATSTSTSDYAIGGALNPAYYTNKGAFNGSGIALASQSFGVNDYGALVMYFQHAEGQIRWQRLDTASGDWVGGTSSEIVAYDAKNGTPISAVSYALNNTSQWHIFYIDNENRIRQRSNSNTSNVWVDGNINQLNLTANNADQVGMQACWYGSDYGDSDYEVGMHIWYASDHQTFQQLGWRHGDVNWTFQGSWVNKNGHAGVGCYSWGPGTVTYVMMVNLDNAVEIWWKDTNNSLTSTTGHPINAWTNYAASVTIPNVHPSTSLGYTNYFYIQEGSTNLVKGYNISWNAEKTSIVSQDTFTVGAGGNPGLPGTHLSVSALPDTSGGNSVVVFYQTVGNDITEFVRDLEGGQWTTAKLPIPDS